MWGVDGLSATYPFFKAAGSPSVCINQTHYCYRDASNNIQDVVWTGQNWAAQQIAGPGSASGGPAAAGDPAVVAFNDEMHCFYRELGTNEVWDAEWSGSSWFSFQLTGKAGLTGAPKARADSNPTAVTYGGQIHCFYRDEHFAAHEIISGTNWSQRVATPIALSDLAVFGHSGASFNQLHCCYRNATKLHEWRTGNVFDGVYDKQASNGEGGWVATQLTGAEGKAPGAPEAFGAPCAVVYSGQTHYCYRDLKGVIWDVIESGGAWTPVQVTGSGGKISAAPAAAGDPFVIVWSGTGYNQMHYCYRDSEFGTHSGLGALGSRPR
jgi:hypothetical protein